MLCLLDRIPDFNALQPAIASLNASVESISKQLGAWVRTLRDSELKGERYGNEKMRRADTAKKDREAFLQELDRRRGAGWGKGGSAVPMRES